MGTPANATAIKTITQILNPYRNVHKGQIIGLVTHVVTVDELTTWEAELDKLRQEKDQQGQRINELLSENSDLRQRLAERDNDGELN